MPRQPIAEEYRTNAGGDLFPRLKFRDKGEKARIAFYEQPWREWVHSLRVPIIEDGKPKKTVKESKFAKGKDREVFDTDFLSNPICLGNIEVLDAKGVDPDNCPVCALAVGSSGDTNLKPRQRFSANVVHYVTRPGTYDLLPPFRASIEVWAFSDNMYDDLLDLQKELPDQKLENHDVLLECEVVQFNSVKMGTRLTPAWQEYPEGVGIISGMLAEPGNTATEAQLRQACGKDSDRAYMQEDADTVVRRWRQVSELSSASTDATGATPFGGGGQPQQLEQGVQQLMGNQAQTSAAASGTPFGGVVGSGAAAAEAQSSGMSEFTTDEASQQARLGVPLDQNGQQAQAQPAAAAPAGANPFGGQVAAQPAAAPPASPFPGGQQAGASTGAAQTAASSTSTVQTASPQTAPPSEEKKPAALNFQNMIKGLT